MLAAHAAAALLQQLAERIAVAGGHRDHDLVGRQTAVQFARKRPIDFFDVRPFRNVGQDVVERLRRRGLGRNAGLRRPDAVAVAIAIAGGFRRAREYRGRHDNGEQ